MKNNANLVYDIHEKPKPREWILLSLQHVLAMFGATVLVPALTGLDTGITLISAGIGTLIYILCTKGKSPVFLGSSFAFITPILSALVLGTGLDALASSAFINGSEGFAEKLAISGLQIADLNFIAVSIGLMAVGLVYMTVAVLIKFVGTDWLNKLLPPIVIGPTIMVIGLSLAPTAIGMAQGDGSWQNIVVALFTLLVAVLISTYAKGFLKIIPIMIAILAGYLLSIPLGLVDFEGVKAASWFQLPKIVWFNKDAYGVFDPSQLVSIITLMVPIALVTISEHIGDHLVLSQIIGKDLTKDPGLAKTIAGDGIATFVAGFIGGPANTTYGENTGVVGMTRVASVWVIGLAAVFTFAMGFMGKFIAIINSIPGAVMGGVSMMLFGIIASNGVRVLINNRVDLGNQRNLIIAAVILVSGIGGLAITIGNFTLAGQALSILIGIILHQILPDKKAGFGIQAQENAEIETLPEA